MEHLREWNTKKIVVVLKKLLAILTRKTGERYFLIGVPRAYKNQWGKFLGYYVVSSKKKVFRFNVRLEKVDQAQFVSIDRFKTGFERKPVSTLSCEGYGISKIFYALVDFAKILNPMDTLKTDAEEESLIKESLTVKRENKWTPQPEKKSTGQCNIVGIAANFLGENPSWVSSIASNNLDVTKLVKALKVYYPTHGVPVAGYGTKHFLKPIKLAIAMFDDFGGENSAKNIPIAKTFKSPPEIQIPIAPSQQLDADAQEINDLFSQHMGPKETYEKFMDAVRMMLNSRTTYSGVIAYGPGGTGKTYHAEKVAREEGLSEGVGYITIGGKFTDTFEIMKTFYDNKEIPLVIFDDADFITSPARENLMKHILDSANPYIQFQSDVKTGKGPDEIIEAGKYTIESKFVFCTNLGLDDIGKTDAVLTRCKALSFDFTNDEMKDILRDRFFAMAKEIDVDGSDQLDQSDCDFILNIFQALIDGQKINRFNFRLMNNVIFDYTLAKAQNLDRKKAVIFAVKLSPVR